MKDYFVQSLRTLILLFKFFNIQGTVTQCCNIVGTPSTTLAQHWNSPAPNTLFIFAQVLFPVINV